jgi:hypothetical protein
VDTADAAICEKISKRATSMRDGLLRFQCLWYVAVNTHNRKLCQRVPEAGDLPGMNPFLTRSGCYESIAITGKSGVGYYGPERFPHPQDWQQSLGDLGATEFIIGLPPPSADDYWEFLSKWVTEGDPVKRSQFLQHVREMQ